jgi:hypothetical protein
MDGSEEGGVGAAAILYKHEARTRTVRYHLKPAKGHTVYEAELVGSLLDT